MSTKYPFAPLAAAMCLSEAQACRELGIAGSTAQEYRRLGMSEKVADRLAVKAGLHPFLVWPELVEFAITELERIDYIQVMSARAKNRDRKAAERAASTRVREREAEYCRAYRASLSDAAKAQQLRAARSYKAAHADEIAKRNVDYKTANRERLLAQRRAYYQRNRDRELARQREYDRRRRGSSQPSDAMVA